ncbi:MAG TPA: hypothetical protein VFE46_05870, partial [Pirellulales bacterium]|nr:hypothetical protein [Pirellulales bacterium]
MKLQLFAGIVLFVASRVYILCIFQAWSSDIENPYFIYAVQVADEHVTPYQGESRIEYPPLAWWAIYIPRLLDSHTTADLQDPRQLKSALAFYKQVFRGIMCACDVGSFLLLLGIVWVRRPQMLPWAAFTYTLLTSILAHLLYDRLDMALLFLVMAWAFCWVHSLEASRRSLAWSIASYAILGLSISFKLIPIICVPVLMIADWYASQRSIRLTVGVAFLLLTACAPFVIQYL